MALCVKKARSVNPELECGICGEHAGDPKSISFCHEIGLTYVSCSPYRVPVARLAAAHAALLDKTQGERVSDFAGPDVPHTAPTEFIHQEGATL
jgi:phosphoenolpyruvate-protein kinase (PTS system EI component)